MYQYKKEDLDCKYCRYYKGGKCLADACCCLKEKVQLGSPFAPGETKRALTELMEKLETKLEEME